MLSSGILLQMRNYRLFLLICPWVVMIVAACIVSCSKEEADVDLRIENLILEGKVDMAESLVDSLENNTSGFSDSGRLEFFRLAIKAERGDSDIPPASMEDYARMFEEKKDRGLAALAYYYEGCILYRLNNLRHAANVLKKAEENSTGEKNPFLDFNLSKMLFFVNHYYGDGSLARDYARRVDSLARITADTAYMLKAIFYKTAVLMADGNNSEAVSVIKTAMNLEPGLSDEDKARMYNNIGYAFMDSDINIAGRYIMKSLSYRERNAALANMAEIYARKGYHRLSDSLWKRALVTDNMQLKVEMLGNMFETKREIGEYEEATGTAAGLIEAKDSLSKKLEDGNVLAEQLRVEHEAEKNAAMDRIRFLWFGIVIIVFTAVVIILYFLYRKTRMKEEISNEKLLGEILHKRIEALEKDAQSAVNENREKNIELSRLKERLGKLREKQNEVYANGKMRLGEIEAGGNIVSWKKKDIDDCVEYYSLVDMPFMLGIETMYDGLTNKNKLFLILQHLGKSDAEIQTLFGVGANAIRTIRSRIKAKASQ